MSFLLYIPSLKEVLQIILCYTFVHLYLVLPNNTCGWLELITVCRVLLLVYRDFLLSDVTVLIITRQFKNLKKEVNCVTSKIPLKVSCLKLVIVF